MIGPNQEKLLLTLESFLKFRIDNDSIKSDSLLAEYKKRMGEDFQISEFHRIILQNGIIPLHELKKEVFSL